MNITSIEVKNIKGLESAAFKLQILPNKPNLLVAPNGFGKSSIATAFASMNSNRITLADKDYFKEDKRLQPELSITAERNKLTANKAKNDIRKKFDVAVIRNGLVPKATKKNMGRFTQATASLEVESINLCKIPKKVIFNYKYRDARDNGAFLTNISQLLNDPRLCEAIQSCDLERALGQRVQQAIDDIFLEIKRQRGSGPKLRLWAAANVLEKFRAVPHLNNLAKGLLKLSLVSCEIDAYLSALQVINIYKADKKAFAESIKWLKYTELKQSYSDLLTDFRSSQWQWATLSENKKKKNLSIIFPKAHQLSNGQRDLVTLVVQMHKALYEGSKKPLILIIDEVFDYLDDANLVAFQYYVVRLIEEYKEKQQDIYPVILTHLDPGVFFDFCFNKHKLQINYLQTASVGKSKGTLQLIKARDEVEAITELLETHWFHFHPETAKLEYCDWPNGVPNDWQKSEDFHKYTENELKRYLRGANYDPLAVCFYLRVEIERQAYELLVHKDQKERFLETHTTKKKIGFVADHGISIPEIYFLLGLIYNTNLHWSQSRDFVSPLVSKLNHPTIHNLVCQVHSNSRQT